MIYIGLGIISLFVLFALIVLFEVKRHSLRTELHVLQFIIRNPARASLYIIENGETVADLQSGVKRPLASVAKIIVLAELAEQAASGTINLEEKITIGSLNKFYIPNSDGSAHSEWLFDLKAKGTEFETEISLYEVARGMMKYSSNANTEFLMDRLGLDSINARLQTWGLKDHDVLYPFSSAILMPAYLKASLSVSWRQAASIINNYSYSEYAARAIEIFNLLRNDSEGIHIRRLNLRQRARAKFQRLWSDKLPRSTAKEYAHLLKNIYEGELLSGEARAVFQNVMNLQLPNQQFKIAAQKGGSSLSILNIAMFYEDNEGNQTEMALFVHDPMGGDQIWLEKKLVRFTNQYFMNEAFRKKVLDACAFSARHRVLLERDEG